MAKDEDDDPLPDKDAAKEFYAKYEPKEILGRGISSTVRRCIEKLTGKEYAAKIIDLGGAATEAGDTNPLHILEATRQEINILRQVIGHPYIIELQDVFESEAFVFLVFELCPKGELFDYLTSVVTLSEKRTRTIMRQIFEGVEYIHAKNIVHRDLKPENILLDENHNVKITDFGFARQMVDNVLLTDLCGTPGYLAPETLRCNMFEGSPGYGREVDIWACGVIMFTLLVGCPPFWHRKQMIMLRNIMEGKYSFTSPEWADISEEPKDLIRKCLVVDPAKRITVHDVLQHPFFNQMVLVPELSPNGQNTTYHLREQSVHRLREHSKYFNINHNDTKTSLPLQQQKQQQHYEELQQQQQHLTAYKYDQQQHAAENGLSLSSVNLYYPNSTTQTPARSQTQLCYGYGNLTSNFTTNNGNSEDKLFVAPTQLPPKAKGVDNTKIDFHEDYHAETTSICGLFSNTQQLRQHNPFEARKKFQFVILVVRAVIRIKRLRFTAETLHIQDAIHDPYRIKMLRKVIDGCAFRVYGHWVQKGEGQNRAALFENTPRTELHTLYINNLNQQSNSIK